MYRLDGMDEPAGAVVDDDEPEESDNNHESEIASRMLSPIVEVDNEDTVMQNTRMTTQCVNQLPLLEMRRSVSV
jgi:hypothetical protein